MQPYSQRLALRLIIIGTVSVLAARGGQAPETSAGIAQEARRLWSFGPVREPALPAVKHVGWASSPIDHFILASLEEKGLSPAPAAARDALIRRVTFDLTGLPPAPREIAAFLADESPQAFARVVDRLLASPAYGERWGRHWLDLVRYAETSGSEPDVPMRDAWRYRDYVIGAFNSNTPMDRFICEQVAGDEMWPEDPRAVSATAMYSIGPVNVVSGYVDGAIEYEYRADAVDTTGEALLGLTIACARCHDHKYDPITQRDYFAMQAIFAASERVFPEKARELRIKSLNGLLADKPLPAELLNDPRCRLRSDRDHPMRLLPLDPPVAIRRLHRGELSKPLEVVDPALPAVLVDELQRRKPAQVAPHQRRTVLAQWLVSRENPLTSRVLANRIWAWHFGQPLVATPNDFGSQGEPPTHPQLLDWLARQLMDRGWDLKRLHRVIVTSQTYQMSVASDSVAAMDADPDNRLLWHFPRRRLEAEAIRDSMLACAGTLNLQSGGPPVMPPLSAEESSGLFGTWEATRDATQHTRRSVYVHVRRTFPLPMMAAFDPPQVTTSCPQRSQTVLPTQALTLLNSGTAVTQSQAFASRLVREAGPDGQAIAERAWLIAFGRPIREAEMQRVSAWLQGRLRAISPADAGEEGPLHAALAELCLALFNANEFVYLD